MIRILLVDDDELMRAGLRMILEQCEDFAVVGEAADGAEAIKRAGSERPDVMLVDIRMPGINGIDATNEIVKLPHPPKVVILTTFEHDEYVFEALRAGASGFLLKRTPPEHLVAGIRSVVDGEGLLSPSVTRRLIDEFARAPVRTSEADPRIERLTDREREVLVEMARGLTNDELAETLYIGANTVKTHVKRVIAKLGARDRVQAVVIAYESGLMD